MMKSSAAVAAVLALFALPAAAEEGLLRSTFGYEIRNHQPPADATDAQKSLIADVAILAEAARGSYEPDATRYAAMSEYARWLLSTQGICGNENGGEIVWSNKCSSKQKTSPLDGYEF